MLVITKWTKSLDKHPRDLLKSHFNSALSLRLVVSIIEIVEA